MFQPPISAPAGPVPGPAAFMRADPPRGAGARVPTMAEQTVQRFTAQSSAGEAQVMTLLRLSAKDIDTSQALRALRDQVRKALTDALPDTAATLTEARRQRIVKALGNTTPAGIAYGDAGKKLHRTILTEARERPLSELHQRLTDRLTGNAEMTSQRMLQLQSSLSRLQQLSTLSANLLAGLHETNRAITQRL